LQIDHYLASYAFSTLQKQFQPEKDLDKALAAQLYVFLPSIIDTLHIQ
jgi:hypothetical protein